jgi:hypothetical protein
MSREVQNRTRHVLTRVKNIIYILSNLNILIHVRKGVVTSVGRVVTPEQFYQKDVSSIRLLVRRWVIMGCYKRTFVVSERSILSNIFYRVYFASEKHVTRTSKTPYSWKAVKSDFTRSRDAKNRNGRQKLDVLSSGLQNRACSASNQ